MKNNFKNIVLFIALIFSASNAFAQTTTFTYQGKLTDGGMPPTAQYDFQFTIFGSDVGGLPVSGDIIVENVPVTNGIFTVNLDFGASPFDSPTDNHLEISVRPGASVGAFTLLSPRQRITSAPYSIKTLKANLADSLSALCVLCVTDAQIFSIDAVKVTGVLNQTNGGTGLSTSGAAGNFLRSDGTNWTSSALQVSDILNLNTNFIQNATTTQLASNFNISGNGIIGSSLGVGTTAPNERLEVSGSGIVRVRVNSDSNSGLSLTLNSQPKWSVATASPGQFQIYNDDIGQNALWIDSASNNIGIGTIASGARLDVAGSINTSTQFNIGGNRVLSAAGTNNLFAGVGAGQINTGTLNAFFGTGAGEQNTTGGENAFFGFQAGFSNQTGLGNSFFGKSAGAGNTSGQLNSFVGGGSGFSNSTGSSNSFFGLQAGDTNTTGSKNTIIGKSADVATNNLSYATAIGADSVVSSSNTVVLGRNLDTVQIPGALNVTGAITFGGTLGANIFNATTQYNIGGNRVLSATGTNLIVGIDAGPLNTGFNNSFFGRQAGQFNTTGTENSFFGTFAGRLNTGDFNSFFGARAGELNMTGQRNSFFGYRAGVFTNASANSFFGDSAGAGNTSGSSNTFFGVNAGDTNTTGSGNTIIGESADVGANNLTNATAIGAGATVSQSNSLVLGSAANVGIGTTAPNAKLHVAGGNVFIANPGGNLIMTSPNGACWAISVSDTGVLSTASVACP